MADVDLHSLILPTTIGDTNLWFEKTLTVVREDSRMSNPGDDEIRDAPLLA